ncbi:HEAT repeat domain-containing protein [Tropicibacter naphthalenivorans]|uniref:HEAT repeat n=1 Tax=Tropicibacter naphthalenivorans TaxID=441103 RepID=A0A0P1GA58_9RHOB|nr:HEAT repeat domain-containing protein [Tropicibacter naphthalenivorans]CUH78231.1 hypothetical protein TRN7648_01866 [Tropicibacter naphthalenivorans]SMC78539.1 hypothetical protein SAMN04488093_10428 [Tropicibacter naphthalenivorans]
MLEGLDQIDWAALRHAYGPAADVPGDLRALALGGERQAAKALERLYSNIYHQGTRYTATVAAVPFIAEMALARRDRAARCLTLLAAIAQPSVRQMLDMGLASQGYYQEMAGQARARRDCERAEGETYGIGPDVDADVHAAVARALPALLPLFRQSDPAVTAALIELTGQVPQAAGATLPHLRAALGATPDTASDEGVTLAAIRALGQLGQTIERPEVTPDLTALLTPDHSALIRARAAVALCDIGQGQFEPLTEALTAAATIYDQDAARPPGHGWTIPQVARALRPFCAAHGPEIAHRLIKVLPIAAERGVTSTAIVDTLITALLDGAPTQNAFTGRRRSKLGDLDRKALGAIAEHGPWRIADRVYGNFTGQMRGYGLPDTAEGLAHFARKPGFFKRLAGA